MKIIAKRIRSSTKSTSDHIFYRHNDCKNNKFELLLQSLFDIINPIKNINFEIFVFDDIIS